MLFRKKKLSNKQEDSNVRKAKYTPKIRSMKKKMRQIKSVQFGLDIFATFV